MNIHQRLANETVDIAHFSVVLYRLVMETQEWGPPRERITTSCLSFFIIFLSFLRSLSITLHLPFTHAQDLFWQVDFSQKQTSLYHACPHYFPAPEVWNLTHTSSDDWSRRGGM